MLTNWLRSVARKVVPGGGEAGWLKREADELLRRSAACRDLGEKVDLMLASPAFFALQKRSEILGLLRMVEGLRPARVCEIGSQQGGTLFLLGQVLPPGAKLLSLDIHHTPACRVIAGRIGERTPTTCLTADSHDPATVEKVRDWLGGEPLDFLFIDGDHSYDGVKRDYEAYGPLVRPGGLFAFHDINPLRPGVDDGSGANPGDVPRFWAELRPTLTDFTEYVEDPSHGGYGIAVVRRNPGL